MSVAARRAVVRWAWRLFRREWRQQILVLTLLTVVVAAAVGLATAAYNLAPVPVEAEYGTANSFFTFNEPEPEALQSKLEAGEEWFGAIDVIGHRSVSVPGSIETVDYRTQDPQGPFGGPMLDLRDGRFPVAVDEIAVTDRVAETFGLDIGTAFSLDGVDRTVVGLVENPSDLDDEFALLAPSLLASSDSVSMFVDASQERVESFRPPGDTGRIISTTGDLAEDVFAAVSVLVVSAVALFLVSLVAAASFVVVAQRRLRQLGMLAAVGATERHLRLVMVASGAVTGAVAATLGAILGVAGWVGRRATGRDRGRLSDRRVQRAVVVGRHGHGARRAGCDGRGVVAGADDGPHPDRVGSFRSAAPTDAGASLGSGGRVLRRRGRRLPGAGGRRREREVGGLDEHAAHRGRHAGRRPRRAALQPGGDPGAGRCASRFPIAPRLALRDLGRYQARSGAALAAISLALGIPVAIVVMAAAAEHTAAAGNLSDRQLLVRTADIDGPFVPEAADVAGLQAGVDRLVASLDEPTVIALDAAVDPAATPSAEFEGRMAISLAERVEDGWSDVSLLYVATPELLERDGLDLDRIEGEDGEILTVETAELAILGVNSPSHRSDPEMVEHAVILPASYSSLPGSFITPEGLQQRGWEAVPSGRWLVETSRPLTDEQLSTARDVAAGAGLTIESRDEQQGLAALRTGATAVGMLLALGVLAMTVGLIRSESAADVRTLTATGATSGTRRTLTAATAAALAFLGVVLGTAGAYMALMAGHVRDLDQLSPVPVVHLAAIVLGTPLAAAGAGWLLAGREPTALARQPIP